MAWNDELVVQFRGNTINDPTDVGSGLVMVEIAVVEFSEYFEDASSGKEEYDDLIEVNQCLRWRLVVECNGFDKYAQSATSDKQGWNDYLKLAQILQAMPYKWVTRTYIIGTNKSQGPIPRGNSDDTDSRWNLRSIDYLDTSETYPYDPPGVLPMPVVLDGDLKPERENGSFYKLSFELLGSQTTTT